MITSASPLSLTGWAVPVLVGLVTLLAFAGLVVLWPRLSKTRPVVVVGRAAGLAMINTLVLLLAALLLNHQFLFFASWADVANSLGGRTAGSTIDRGSTPSGAAAAPVRPGTHRPVPPPAVRLPALPAGSGSRISYVVHGAVSGITSTVVVQLPPGYDQAGSSTYPVLETFQGYPGAPTQWLESLHLDRLSVRAAAAGQLRTPIIISPQTEVPVGVDAECVDGGGTNPRVETWLTRDVPDWVVQHLHVRTDRQSWAAIGLSAGGWCAAMAAMRHPDTYSAAIVMAGYFRPWFGQHYRPFDPGSARARSYDLVALARRSPPPVAIWLQTSHADRDSYPTSAEFLDSVRAPTAVTAKVLTDAGHRMGVWVSMLPEALQWLGTNVPGFSPR